MSLKWWIVVVIRAALVPSSTGQVWVVVNLDNKLVKNLFLLNRTIEYYSLVPRERHERKESNDSTLGLCIVPKESHGCPGLHSKAFSSKTNHNLFSLQNCWSILIRVMGKHLVKVLCLMRVKCGTRVTLLSVGTREYPATSFVSGGQADTTARNQVKKRWKSPWRVSGPPLRRWAGKQKWVSVQT